MSKGDLDSPQKKWSTVIVQVEPAEQALAQTTTPAPILDAGLECMIQEGASVPGFLAISKPSASIGRRNTVRNYRSLTPIAKHSLSESILFRGACRPRIST